MEGDENSFGFEEVLGEFKGDGSKRSFTRIGWNGKDQYISLQAPDENSKMRLPYIYITLKDGNVVPWVASHSDLLSQDWKLCKIQ
ncbi:unnamed protein product [marine sediment metagenome]|uniref:Thoeris anti-defense 2-like domain-containing protein n=1 Tax=marine sediment metagenome TaxID=412755 RepID=X1D8K1_9ZZZZ